MSNPLFIEIIESRTAGSNSYGKAINKGFPSMEALLEEYPTRMDLLQWVERQTEFAGAFTCKGTEVVLDATTGIAFAGFPEDDSITAIQSQEPYESQSGA